MKQADLHVHPGWAPSAVGNEVFLANENAFTPSPTANDRYIRRLPVVNEAPPAQVVPGAGQLATQMPSSQAPMTEAIPITTTVTAWPHQPDNSHSPANEHPAIYREEPIISFSQQQPVAQRIQSAPAKSPEVEVLPFAAIEPSSIAAMPITHQSPNGVTFGTPNVTSDSSAVRSPSETPLAPPIQQTGAATVSEIRPSVERFVKAQGILAETGEPQRIHNAFIQLNRLYEHRELSEAERAFMTTYLDKMALQVIYSRDAHILEKPHTVKPGESIDQIARQYNIPAALLMKINGLTGSRPLEPGTPLKIVVGPFDAKLSTQRGEMTLILGGLYAGRFTVTLGDQVKNLRGERHIISKTFSYGDRFMTLDNGTTLRETDRSGRGVLPNTVYFSEKDGQELFDILSEHSIISFED